MSDSQPTESEFPEEIPDAHELSPFDVESLAPSASPAPSPATIRLPTPGILGSIGWSVTALLLHLLGGFIALAIILTMEISKKNIPPEQVHQLAQDEESLMELIEGSPGIMIGAEMVTFGLGVIALTLFYFRANLRAALPLQIPRWPHVLLILAWFMPLSIFCSQLAVWANIGWNDFASNIPELAPFKDFNTMEQISALRDQLSFGTMLLLVAVIPAVAEELLFRGIIGRGLLARYGGLGILLTTIFFAGVHMHPAHVLAVAPLSIAIHWGYLATRNLWIPILAHFLNNSWAVVAMYAFQANDNRPEPALLADDALLPWWMTASAFVSSVALGWLLWEMRTIYRTPDRERWELPFLSTDRPPAELGCRAELLQPSVESVSAGVLGLMLFWGLFVWVILQEIGRI